MRDLQDRVPREPNHVTAMTGREIAQASLGLVRLYSSIGSQFWKQVA